MQAEVRAPVNRAEFKTMGKLSTALLDCWQYGGDDRAWQYDPAGGHVLPVAYSRGGMGEVCGALLLGLFLELMGAVH